MGSSSGSSGILPRGSLQTCQESVSSQEYRRARKDMEETSPTGLVEQGHAERFLGQSVSPHTVPPLDVPLTRRAFNWHALGVPKNQMNCFLQDGTVEDFVKATLDPIPSLGTLRVSAVHSFRIDLG